jgi:3-deoxy-manno-octulosonate cytidylyltransferase (CMP-KDO synthetase)
MSVESGSLKTDTSARAVGVIPARWASTRLPGKSLVPLCGKPMVQWVVERAKLARSLSDVVVATDDQRIMDAVEAFGGRAVMTRPDHPSGTDRIAEATCDIDADLVVNIQGDEPLVEPALIDKLVAEMQADQTWDMGTAASRIECTADLADPSVVKVVWAADHRALYFSRSVIPYVRDEAMQGTVQHWRHLGIYAYRRGFLERLVASEPCVLEEAEKLEQLRALHLGGRMIVLETTDHGIGVDTPADVPRAEQLIREAGLHG